MSNFPWRAYRGAWITWGLPQTVSQSDLESRGELYRPVPPGACHAQRMGVPYKRFRQAGCMITLLVCITVITYENMYARSASCATTERCTMRKKVPYRQFYPLRNQDRIHAHVTPRKVFQHYCAVQLLFFTYINFVQCSKT